MKYARVVALLAQELNLQLEDALSFFYDSDTYKLMSEGIADLHCRSDEYLVEELKMEHDNLLQKDIIPTPQSGTSSNEGA